MTGLHWTSFPVSSLFLTTAVEFISEGSSDHVWTTTAHATDTYNSKILSNTFKYFYTNFLIPIHAKTCGSYMCSHVHYMSMCPLLQCHCYSQLTCVSCTLWHFVRPQFPWTLRGLCHPYPHTGQLCGLACLNRTSASGSSVFLSEHTEFHDQKHKILRLYLGFAIIRQHTHPCWTVACSFTQAIWPCLSRGLKTTSDTTVPFRPRIIKKQEIGIYLVDVVLGAQFS